MKNEVAIIEGVYDLLFPDMPTSFHRWGRIVWLHNIEVGLSGQLLFIQEGELKKTNLSCISNIIKNEECLEIYTKSNIYKLRFLS